jgi:CRISPR-associated protein Cmr4
MYQKAYGIIKTLAPLHVGSTAGEETGNLNLIFREQFTQTGMIPASSIRGRLRADLFAQTKDEEQVKYWYGRASEKKKSSEETSETNASERSLNYEYESLIKLEHASIVWLPVFCPGQPIVWVSCPLLLERYKRIRNMTEKVPKPGTSSLQLNKKRLFFNLGFLELKQPGQDLSNWFPPGIIPLNNPPGKEQLPAVIVENNEMGMIHDMALYRQSRVALEQGQKVVENFFNVEALPEGTILIFPIALKKGQSQEKTWEKWEPLEKNKEGDVYLGGLESVGFGHCWMKLEKIEEKTREENV